MRCQKLEYEPKTLAAIFNFHFMNRSHGKSAWIQQNLKSAYKDSICKLSTFSDWSKNLTIYFGLYTVYWLMLYLKNRNRYQHVLGTKMSRMTNFIFNFNTCMGLKINAFWVIKEKHILVGRHLGLWAWSWWEKWLDPAIFEFSAQKYPQGPIFTLSALI